MQTVFIINPIAGKSDATKHISKMVHKIFMNHKLEGTYRIEVTTKPNDAKEIARKYAKSGQPVTIVACGGDGTMNEVLNGVIGYENVTLGVYPIGTGNDFIKAFGDNAASTFLDLEQLLLGRAIPMDVMDVNGTYSLNIINVGLDAMVAYNMPKFKRIPLIKGKSAYTASIGYSFFTSFHNKIRAEIDGTMLEHDDYTILVAANGRYYGGAYCAAPYAQLQDGELDFVTVPALSRASLLKLLPIYQKGEHLQPKYKKYLQYNKGKCMKLYADEPLPVCVDGEQIIVKDPVIQIHPKAIKFLIPDSIIKTMHFKLDL